MNENIRRVKEAQNVLLQILKNVQFAITSPTSGHT